MISQLMRDAGRRPDLFHFRGPVPVEQLDQWLRGRRLTIPEDLRELWCQTGGGDLFESETILDPFASDELGDDVDSRNLLHRQQGMSANFLIFHVGACGLSVVDMAAQSYATLNEKTHEVRRTFASVAEWYLACLHREYSGTYRLDPP